MIPFDNKFLVYKDYDWSITNEGEIIEYKDSGVLASKSYRGVVFKDQFLGIKYADDRCVYQLVGCLQLATNVPMTIAQSPITKGRLDQIVFGEYLLGACPDGFQLVGYDGDLFNLYEGDQVTPDYFGPVCKDGYSGIKFSRDECVWIFNGKLIIDSYNNARRLV